MKIAFFDTKPYDIESFEKYKSDDIARGADKILFATDSPWQDQGACAKRFARLPLTDEQRELISHKNAERILGL